jgi:hypothetical protein
MHRTKAYTSGITVHQVKPLVTNIILDRCFIKRDNVGKSEGWHLDVQKLTQTDSVLQIQSANKNEKYTTVACVLVPLRYRDEAEKVPQSPQRDQMSAELSKAVVKGLYESSKSWKREDDQGTVMMYQVRGEFSTNVQSSATRKGG